MRFYGDTAVVIGRGMITAHLEKEDMSVKYSWTDVFVKEKGEWKLAAAHVTIVTKK